MAAGGGALRCARRVVDSDGGLADAQIDLASRAAVRDGVAVLGVDDVEVEVDRAVVDPLRDVVADGRQRAELGGLDLEEHQVAAAFPLLERVRVVSLEAFADRRAHFVEVGEDAVAQLRYHPGGGVLDGALGRRLLLGLAHLGGHDGGHVVLPERLVGVVEHGLSLARVLHHAGLEVVAHGALGHAAPELEHVHAAAQPGPLLHVERRLEVGLLAEREDSHEQVYPRHLASRGVHEPLADGGSGPVDLARHAGLVLNALGEVVRGHVIAVALAEPRVPHRDHVPPGAVGLVLVVQEAQVHADIGHLLVDVVPVGLVEHALPHVPVRVEQAVDLVLGHVLDVRPRDASLGRDVEHLAHGLHGHMPCLGYRPARLPLLAELYYQLRLDFSRHVLLSFPSMRHGEAIVGKAIRKTRNERYLQHEILSTAIG